MPPKKPWPADAVMIVASRAGTERRDQMDGVKVETCRDCGCTLHADTFTVARAETMSQRRGRPVKFFCIECHDDYEIPYHSLPLAHIERHNTEAGRAAAKRAMEQERT